MHVGLEVWLSSLTLFAGRNLNSDLVEEVNLAKILRLFYFQVVETTCRLQSVNVLIIRPGVTSFSPKL